MWLAPGENWGKKEMRGIVIAVALLADLLAIDSKFKGLNLTAVQICRKLGGNSR